MTRDAAPPRSALAELAAELGLGIVRRFAGGEFGATLVTDASGGELVLKAMPSEAWLAVFQRGAALAGRLRDAGYPAPEYVATGVGRGVTWSLQWRLPGEVPDVLGEGHMRQLIALVRRHESSVPEGGGAWLAHQLPYAERSLRTIEETPLTRGLALELAAVIERTKRLPLRDDGVVHNDFHHRNLLAVGDQVTGVFDWEFADVGDWRYDLLTLAFWSLLVPSQVSPSVAQLAVDRLHEACAPQELALFTAIRAISALDFDARVHPDFLPGVIERLETHVAPWWRAAG